MNDFVGDNSNLIGDNSNSDLDGNGNDSDIDNNLESNLESNLQSNLQSNLHSNRRLEEIFQNNINERNQNAPEILTFSLTCYPLVFHHNYRDIEYLEHSNKVILPKSILYELSKYDNIIYPLKFKINNSDIIYGLYEFDETICDIYIPNSYLHKHNLISGCQINLHLVNSEIEKGTKIKLEPHTSNFLDLECQKEFLENGLVKAYSHLTKNTTISIPYKHLYIYFNVQECEPQDTICIIDTDIEVDFSKPIDYVEPQPISSINHNQNYNKGYLGFEQSNNKDSKNNNSKENQDKDNSESDKFVPFSGKGYRLGGD